MLRAGPAKRRCPTLVREAMKRRAWIVTAVVAAAALSGAAWWFTRSGEGAASYRTATIERGALQAGIF